MEGKKNKTKSSADNRQVQVTPEGENWRISAQGFITSEMSQPVLSQDQMKKF